MRHALMAAALWMMTSLPALAQQNTWIQIEAQPSLAAAEASVRSYAARLPDVAGFQLSARWYGIALGPYTAQDAQRQLQALRGQGLISRDSFLVQTSVFRQQFWPVGAAALAPGTQPVTPVAPLETQTETEAAAVEAPAAPVIEEETPRQAQASERLLSRDEKRLLQTALAAEGFYTSAIDGLFGRGTRSSMAAWQSANGLEPTGILTTRQRAALLRSYNSILDGLGMEVVAEARAGIAMQMPTDQIAFKGYEAPFAHYEATGSEGIQLSLISQEGSQARFEGLFSVLQTLDLVPTEGPRELGRDRFTITGIDGERHTTIDVRYADGAMKGYMLVWPPNDDTRLRRVLAEIDRSFEVLPGVLDPALSPATEDQSIDLLAGLEIRQPQRAATGFFVDGRGTVLTAAETLGACERVSIGSDVDADVVFSDAELGLAVLQPKSSIAPLAFATFQSSIPRLRDTVAVAGFSYGGDLGAPTLTLGELAEMRGLDGDDRVKRLELRAEP
ncbi:MAG: serine protease, partial [Pseudomonadota bacterium]